MDDSEEDKGTAQLIASEASAGAKGGGVTAMTLPSGEMSMQMHMLA